MNKPQILILGPSGSGKDVVAQFLHEVKGFRYAGPTSKPLCEIAIKAFTSELDVSSYSEVFRDKLVKAKDYMYSTSCGKDVFFYENIYKHRHKIKDFLYHLGVEYRISHGNLTLIKMLQEIGTDIIVGLRQKQEMIDAIESEHFNTVIWVHRPKLKIDTTMEYKLEDVLEAICNTKSSIRFILLTNNKTYLQFVSDLALGFNNL